MATVLIVGGGLMGLSAAFHLRRVDPALSVTVLERSRIGSAASGASAAGVRVMGRDPAERRLALESLGRWPGLDRELEAETSYRRGGGLRVALDDKAWEAAPGWAAEQCADGVPLETVRAFAAAARRLGGRIEEGVGAKRLVAERGRVVAVERSDGARQGVLVAAGFSGHGFALSPVVGDVLARLALGRDALIHLWRDVRFDRPALAGS